VSAVLFIMVILVNGYISDPESNHGALSKTVDFYSGDFGLVILAACMSCF